ncbi:hypothetical protein MRB53_025271 [Persea americana]|uniref:Uncharacterized protein n=1 Tax=Persea americana TaxID=3435 RepID=A0ACC2LER0_PERAE|nr:hypothetical protein MRB53_025271 [Persea americana]
MELALSIGGRRICGGSGHRFRARQGYGGGDEEMYSGSSSKNGAPVQLDLKLSWSTDTGDDIARGGGGSGSSSSDKSSRGGRGGGGGLALDVNEIPLPLTSVNQKEMVGPSSSEGKRGDWETDGERGCSRCSDEEEEEGGGSTTSYTRKKLRLSKEQSCYLEESFKEHPTLNPKQKLALAKQLSLRPRQVEVWFQNRRARTKLKQTEVDCEFLKKCCESLTEENRRLHRELQDLKAQKFPRNPFHLHGPATMITMCPSCEQLTTTMPSTTGNDISSKTVTFGVSVPKSRFYPFAQRTSAAS